MSRPVPLLTARGLTKAHGRTPALRGASVELRPGEILATVFSVLPCCTVRCAGGAAVRVGASS